VKAKSKSLSAKLVSPSIIIEPPGMNRTFPALPTKPRRISEDVPRFHSLSNSLMAHIEEEYPIQDTIPPAEYISTLKLENEMNTIRFLIPATGESAYARIFKWDDNIKMVISDVDGTITKSDIKGHIYTRLGRVDYTHEGISALYTQIASNGYKFLYLTARPITQVRLLAT
jgi:phosphatidate phosphatase PAH1